MTLTLERMLVAACMPVGTAIHTWGTVATVGASPAAYYLAVLLAILYYSFCIPLPSSFYKKQATRAIGTRRCPCALVRG